MSKFFRIILFAFLIINFFAGAYFLVRGDIFFNTDIARDFLLLDELKERKLVLIGPRASGLNGFFHGPLWMYLNFPVYLLSNGDPVIQGWFWYGLLGLFLLSLYYVAKKLFDHDSALITTTLASTVFTIPYSDFGIYNGFYNPHGALFLAPLFFYTFILYRRTSKPIYLILQLLLSGAIIQFQVAFGGPLFILATIVNVYHIVKNKLIKHFLFYGVLVIPFSTYIVFDLRHNFSHLRAIFTPETDPYRIYLTLQQMASSRIDAIFSTGLHFFREPITSFNSIIGYALAFGIYFFISKKQDSKNQDIYKSIIYFYIGYFLLSLIQNGWVQYFYWMPLFPFVYLFFSRLLFVIPKKLFYTLVLFVLVVHAFMMMSRFKNVDNVIGIDKNSWKFQSNMVKDIFDDADGQEFGFFVRAPDIFGYASKYPFIYWKYRKQNSKPTIYAKKRLTYIVIEPAPKGLEHINNEYNWWKKNKLMIATVGAQLNTYPNGFRIEKFILSEAEVNTPIEPGINDWIYFR